MEIFYGSWCLKFFTKKILIIIEKSRPDKTRSFLFYPTTILPFAKTKNTLISIAKKSNIQSYIFTGIPIHRHSRKQSFPFLFFPGKSLSIFTVYLFLSGKFPLLNNQKNIHRLFSIKRRIDREKHPFRKGKSKIMKIAKDIE